MIILIFLDEKISYSGREAVYHVRVDDEKYLMNCQLMRLVVKWN